MPDRKSIKRELVELSKAQPRKRQGKSPSEHVLPHSTHSEGLLRGENDKQYDRQEKETFEGGVDLYFPVDEVII